MATAAVYVPETIDSSRSSPQNEVADTEPCPNASDATRLNSLIDSGERQKTLVYDSYIGDREEEDENNRATCGVMNQGFQYTQCESEPDDEFKEAIQDERKVWLRKQIESDPLPAELRAVASTYFIQGKTQVQCAEELGWAQSTVSKHKQKIQEYIKMKKAAK
jgi:DNA-directed RNA polymerase specialized sigma subunit